METSRKRSILLMRERGNVQKSSEELMQREQGRRKLINYAQNLLASHIEEYDIIRNAIISEMEIQKDMKWQLEELKNSRIFIKGEYRTEKLVFVRQNEKISAIVDWIMKDAIDSYKKEKDRANALLQRVAEFRILQQKKQVFFKNSQKVNKDKLEAEKGKYTTFLQQLMKKAEALETENQRLAEEYEIQQLEYERLTEIKLARVESRLTDEMEFKVKENDAISKALEKNSEIGDLSQVAILEHLMFIDSDLQKVHIPY